MMTTALADFLAPDLHAVFVGTAAGDRSAARGHYYAGPGNETSRWVAVVLEEAGIVRVGNGPPLRVQLAERCKRQCAVAT